MRKCFLRDPLHTDGGITINCKDDRDCVFCERCTDVWWDYTNLIYMIACADDHDPWERPCEYFKEGGRTMSYDVCFMVKVEGKNKWVEVGCCDANITWNLRDMIVASTGLEWKNEDNNGLCKDVIPAIKKGYNELQMYPDKYKKYESPNGWGTIGGCVGFFGSILEAWRTFLLEHEDLVDVVTFWIW